LGKGRACHRGCGQNLGKGLVGVRRLGPDMSSAFVGLVELVGCSTDFTLVPSVTARGVDAPICAGDRGDSGR
jgi:hypothetical protein